MRQEGYGFFFEKKEPKNFCHWRRARVMQTRRAAGAVKEVLWFFLSRKNCFLQ
jgi:hypothetical protein